MKWFLFILMTVCLSFISAGLEIASEYDESLPVVILEPIIITIDTNASTACGGAEYLAGNGTCINISAVADTDTNASTACSGTEVLLGNGTCIEGSYFDTDTNISDTNCSNVGDCPNILYTTNESSLNVNGSVYWNTANQTNSTQFEVNNGVLWILESWFSTLFDALFGAKDTDDLIEGTINLYDNQSWNQSHADTLYSNDTDTTCADDGSCINLTYLDYVNTGEFILTGNITITGTNNATIYNNGTHLIFT